MSRTLERTPEVPVPNIVFIVVDDLGWADLACTGSTFYQTPNLDRLAAQGVRFTQAYAAAPVCSPTRSSLLSGRYPARTGVTQYIGGHAVGQLRDVPYLHCLSMDEYSLARALRDGGYQTWHVGKWHLGGPSTWPERHGFEVNVGGCSWGHPRTYWSPYGCPTLADGPTGEYLTDRLTDEAIKLVDRSDGRPFFLNLWHYAVHTPIQSPPALVEKYRRKAAALGLDDRPAIVPGEPMPTWHQQGERVMRRLFQSDPEYAAMIENLDANIGRLVSALDAAGVRDNTMIIFTSDNGGLATAETSPTCNSPLAEGKGWMEDGGVRVPLIVSWPGVTAPGSDTDVSMTSPDFYPTLLEAAGLPLRPDQHLDGISFLPVLHGEQPERGPLYWHYPHYGNQGGTPGAAVRDGRFKLIRLFETGSDRLFDLEADIGEEHDLVDHEPLVGQRMSADLDRWLIEVSALIPHTNPNSRWDDLPG